MNNGIERHSIEGGWSATEESIIAEIQCSETRHDPECQGCTACEEDSKREPCHILCDRLEAIRRLQRRTKGTVYYPPTGNDLLHHTKYLKRWPEGFLAARRASLGLVAAA